MPVVRQCESGQKNFISAGENIEEKLGVKTKFAQEVKP